MIFLFCFQTDSSSFFFQRLFSVTHMLKAGLCWVEYIFSIRGLFLPTVSWNLAGGEDGIVGEQHVGGWAPWRLFPRGFSL